jgi:hypothetical protein
VEPKAALQLTVAVVPARLTATPLTSVGGGTGAPGVHAPD